MLLPARRKVVTYALVATGGVILLFAAYVWVALSWSYSTGDRGGFVQKISKKGWICKTWEGELTLVALPASMPEKFFFTIRESALAAKVDALVGK